MITAAAKMIVNGAISTKHFFKSKIKCLVVPSSKKIVKSSLTPAITTITSVPQTTLVHEFI